MIVQSAAVVLAAAVLASAGDLRSLPAYTPDATADRSSIPAAYRWDLTPLFPDDAAWAAAFADTEAKLAGLQASAAGLDRPEALAAFMATYFEVELTANRLTLYANLQRDGDTTNPELIARHQRALKLTSQVMEQGAALRQAVLGHTTAELEKAYLEVPALATFRPWIDSLRRRADRILDPEAERVLSLAGDNLWAAIDLNELPSPLESAFAALIAELPLPKVTGPDGEEVQLTFANYPRLRASDDRRVRRDAVAGMFAALRHFENTFAATLGGQVAFNVFLAKARDYDTAIEHLKVAIRKDKNEDQFYFLLGLSHLMAGDEKAARRWSAKAQKVAETDEQKSRYSTKIETLIAASRNGR
jgi:oligoendopeptidase F